MIITDGDPVYRYRSSVSDWDLSLHHLRSLVRAGITPIGVYLGNDNGEPKSGSLEKLHKLFNRLVIVGDVHRSPDGNALPEKLGSLLSSLA